MLCFGCFYFFNKYITNFFFVIPKKNTYTQYKKHNRSVSISSQTDQILSYEFLDISQEDIRDNNMISFSDNN